ncbi:conserved Plasmodium protein, unknown function [Plasmodium berghei]|uniref:SHSP domain-containing protein n=2 Tax=Plasmodium berghei TaxID=5821 RepID=A0A509ASR1_PLABA|nr:conserved Plasmodium protein, unknown function [Plasmodium berghei ANKA]CXJ25960.1 conserved Plasmodium protein, unknown function [Plasmodium berghei]SCM26897.1 conserved Plasmodium protein, unknown function [Plasmodium berghei]SCN28691.1 conserved Plasmodium protein, unknown function [Plasmodium berghei]SCO62926.1 conserved Plasmodium protein, unknown function [Plasmodium berghei]SCO64439.1 conserved Plasmodium protein, unknown function [Plasmodium berghei]|eukprot:XP_034424336.1 conserved Plasmodium protein, unknown function [Plasmodium berghei ANKA]
MENIEVLKRSLNTEKVFYELDWHKLDMDKSFGDSIYDKFERLESNDNLILNKKAKYNVNKKKIVNENMIDNKKNGDKNNIEKNCKSILINKEGNPIESKKKNTCKEIKWDCNYNSPLCAYNNDANKYEQNPIPSTPLCSCIREKSPEKKSIYEIKKCNFIKEVNSEDSSKICFVPSVDILYDNEKVIFLFFISGNLENFSVQSTDNYITISGNKIPYDIQKCANYYSHEIKKGYFLRTYFFMKEIDKENIHYEHKHGIMKVCVYLLK